MKEKQKYETGKKLRAPALLRRIARGLGARTIDRPIDPQERPEISPFDARTDNVIDYVRRNAAMAGIDHDEARFKWLTDEARRIQEAYGAVPSRGKEAVYGNYGFKESSPRNVFQWGQEQMSIGLAEDVLYCFGGHVSGEPTEEVMEDGAKRVRQEYTTSMGLNFIDTRNVYDDPNAVQTGIHSLGVYMPEASNDVLSK